MKINWNLMRDIIRVDLITMRGGRNNTLLTLILFSGFMGLMGFIVSPLGGLYVPLLLGGFFVPLLFNNEMKYHSGKLWSLLPVERRDLVNARFLLSVGCFIAADLVFYLLMLLAQTIKLWKITSGVNVDIIEMTSQRLGYTELGFFNLCYFGVSAFALGIMASSLRKYFRDPDSFSNLLSGVMLRKSSRTEVLWLLIIGGVFVFWLLVISGILPLGMAAQVVIRLISQLARAANGYLLGAVLLTVTGFHTAYQYISTLIEYDQREL